MFRSSPAPRGRRALPCEHPPAVLRGAPPARRLARTAAGLEDATLAAYLASSTTRGIAQASASTAVAAACFRARLAREPNPAGERSGRVLVGDRGRGQSRAFGVADLAAVLATCHRPRGVAADRLALERGRLDDAVVRVVCGRGRDPTLKPDPRHGPPIQEARTFLALLSRSWPCGPT